MDPLGEVNDVHGTAIEVLISTLLRADANLSDEGAEALDELIKATYERLRKDR